jgi:hypothetical protein
MSSSAKAITSRLAILFLSAAVLAAAGCNSTTLTGSTQSSSQPTGPSFVVGTDAPMASVVSFAVQLESIDAINSSGTSVPLLSGTPVVDFARFNGLQTLVDMNDVPAGTYNSVVITLGQGTIGFLNTKVSGAPTIYYSTPTFSPSSTVTINLSKPFTVVNGGSPVGLRIDFDLAQSIQVDSNGDMTGVVDPTFDVRAVTNNDGGAYIDSLIGGVLYVDPQSFVVKGPHGERFTINVNGNTEWDGDASLSTLNTNSVVEVSGKMDNADQTLDADEVAVLTDSNFYSTGLMTYVTPATGQASSFDFYVRGGEPTQLTDVQLGGIAQVNLTGNEKYGIYWMHNAFTRLLFNASALTPGQEIAVGGTDAEATPSTGTAINVNRIHLRDWGYNGTIVAGSQNSGQGLFQMQVTGFAGVVVPTTVTVYLGPACDFRYGFGAFSDLSDGVKVRVVGLLLKNQDNGNLVLLARHVDGIDFTDMTTANWQ